MHRAELNSGNFKRVWPRGKTNSYFVFAGFAIQFLLGMRRWDRDRNGPPSCSFMKNGPFGYIILFLIARQKSEEYYITESIIQ